MPPTRRAMLKTAMAAPAAAQISMPKPSGGLTDVPGITVGHWTSDERPTGCTAILCGEGAVAGVDVRGGGPGTRETDLLRPETSVQEVHGICLAGGSAYGLAAADGVMAYLEEQGSGFRAGRSIVPIVPAAILFDLGFAGDASIRPNKASGYSAAKAAASGEIAQGNVGAGAGATVGKLFGAARSMKGGVGTASIRLPGGIVVGALAAVNALGDVVDPDSGQILAGALNEDRDGFANAAASLHQREAFVDAGPQNTTIGVVAANVSWTQAQAMKASQMAHDGLARAIRPAHMPFDGDTIFALGTGGPEVDANRLAVLGAVAADVFAQAVVSAVLHAEASAGRPANRDLKA